MPPARLTSIAPGTCPCAPRWAFLRVSCRPACASCSLHAFKCTAAACCCLQRCAQAASSRGTPTPAGQAACPPIVFNNASSWINLGICASQPGKCQCHQCCAGALGWGSWACLLRVSWVRHVFHVQPIALTCSPHAFCSMSWLGRQSVRGWSPGSVTCSRPAAERPARHA
jgi:hypothetical protein